MARNINNILANTDTFLVWLERTNTILDTLEETVTLKANSSGDLSTGNGFITGIFGANTIVASTIKGGNVSSSSNLTISSNTTFSGAQINSTSNVYIESANIQLNTNSSITAIKVLSNGSVTNTNIGGTNLRVTANTLFLQNISFENDLSVSGNLTIGGTLTGNIDISGSYLYTSNIEIQSALIDANGSPGTANQALLSNGTNVYWGTLISGGGYYKGSNGSIGDVNNKHNIFRINANTLNSNVTIAAGENAVTAGPIDLNGYTLTIATGGYVTIV